jgi:hypothetical protein
MSNAHDGCGSYENLFGDFGDDVGKRAIEVLAGLLEPVPDSFTRGGKLVIWSEDDSGTFESLGELETGIKFIEPHPDVDGSDVADLHRTFGRFHTALPFSEAERHWLLDPIHKTSDDQAKAYNLEALVGVTDEVTSGGLKIVIQGRDLVRRLASWRRETGEFAGQQTLDEARRALGDIATTLVLEQNWPSAYSELLARIKAGEKVTDL